MRRFCVLIFLLVISFASSSKVNYPTCTKFAIYNTRTVAPGKATIANDTVTHHRKHKFFAALLAFPFPFGVIGLHRMYLGTSTAVPFLYIATIGGALGILPFVDFVLILLCKDVNVYAHNPAAFMWTRRKK